MKSTDNSEQKVASVKISVDARHKALEDLTRQVVGDIRYRMDNLCGENGQPFTQAMLAKSLDVDPSSISKAISGDANLTLRKISNIAYATGSKCYFLMAADLSSEVNRSVGVKSHNELAMITANTGKQKTNKQKGLSFPGMLLAAKNYVRQVFKESGLFEKGNQNYSDISIKLLDNENRIANLRPDREETDRGIQIHTPGSEIIAIIAEFIFSDGFSEVEWVLYDIARNEHFRSRDLRQVAIVAAVVLARGGFHR